MSLTPIGDNIIQLTRWDKSEDLESAQKLRSLDPAMLVVGHGGPVRSPGPAMDEAIKSARGGLIS